MDSQMKKISEFFPWSAESNIAKQFLLCLDNNAFSGEFILHETILKLLRDGQSVYIISTNHTRNHYQSILRKNAFDLKQLEASGKIFIHLLLVGDNMGDSAWSKLTEWQSTGMPFPSHTQAHTQTPESLSNTHTPKPTCSSENTPTNAHNTHTIESSSLSARSGKQFSIVIDDLDALDMFAPDARTARAFMSKLIQSLTQSPSSSSPGLSTASTAPAHVSVSISAPGVAVRSLHAKEGVKPDIYTIVAYGRQMSSHLIERGAYNRFFPSSLRVNSVSCGEEPFEPSLSEYCRYRCDLSVCVQALTSGYSSEVHGLFTIVHTHTARSSSSSSSSSSRSSNSMNNRSSSSSVSSSHPVGGGGVHRSSRGDHLSKARSALTTQVLHYKALDSGVKCCLSTDMSLS